MKTQSIRTIITAIAVVATITSLSTASTPPPAFPNGNGTASAPYQISTSADLATLSSLINDPSTNTSFADKHYVLVSDIDLSGYDNWTPIGMGLIRVDGHDHRLTFRGVFDGAGKKVTNLRIASVNRIAESFQGVGLFGVVDGGTVKNLGLDGVSIVVDAGQTGGIVGAAVAGSIIADCYVVGDIKGVGSVGGIAGHIDDNSTVVNSYVVGNVSGADRVGGVAGYVYSSAITNCYVIGSVSEDGVDTTSGVAGHVWNSAITDSEVFDHQIEMEKMLAAMPDYILARVVADANDFPAIVVVVNEPSVETGKISVGPNPVDRNFGSVNFFHYGDKLKSGRLSIYTSAGHIVKRVTLSDASANETGSGWRQVGSWDLKDRRGRSVSEGTYLVKGVVIGADGKRERVSIVLSVR